MKASPTFGSRTFYVTVALVAGTLSAPGALRAQRGYDDYGPDHQRYGSRWTVGGGLALTVPSGPFSDFGREGIGFGLRSNYGLDPQGIVGLRFDATFVTHGTEGASLSTGFGGEFIDVVTRRHSGLFGLGPQLTIPAGPVRPYVNGIVGFGWFYDATDVFAGSDCACGGFSAFHTSFSDFAFAYGAGGGLDLQVSRGRPIYVSLDAQFRRHRPTEYLIGSFIDDLTGDVILETVVSEVEVWMLNLGVSVGL